MPGLNDLKNSKYLTKEDVMQEKLVTIDRYEEVNVAMENQPPSLKWVFHFKELDKGMVMNNTNGQRIAYAMKSVYGINDNAKAQDFDTWIGKQVIVYNDPMVEFGGKLVGGIRIKPTSTTAGLTQPQQQTYDDSAPQGFEPEYDPTNDDQAIDEPPI